MIVDALLSAFEAVVGALTALLPEVDPPDLSGMVAGLDPVWGAAGWLNKYVPLDHAAIALGVLVTLWVVLYGIRVAAWLLTKAHVLGGS
jgi:hypothetical protein